MAEHFDVVIVGARCAGSPLGTLLAREGLRVAVLEQTEFPQDTLSSHCIQADSLAFLDRLGVIDRIRATGAPFMTGTDTRLGDFRFAERFPLRPGDVGGAACIRRFVLDPILADAAQEAGVELRMRTKVTGLVRDDGRVAGVLAVHDGAETEIRARLVVGADGRNSTVARLTGARRYHVTQNERWYYWTYFRGANPPPTFVFHRWGDRHIFAAPADNGLYLVGVSPEQDERERFRANLEDSLMRHALSCEPVAEAIAGAQRATKIYGILKFSGYFREPSGAGWVLVGDSGHFKDPAAGRGIGDAFRQAGVITPEIVAGLGEPDLSLDRRLANWGRSRDRKYAEYYWLAADIGKAGAIPAVVPEVVARLYADGKIDRFLNLFSHRSAPSDLMAPVKVLGAAGRLLARGGDRRAQLAEVGELLATRTRRLRLAGSPVFADEARPLESPRSLEMR